MSTGYSISKIYRVGSCLGRGKCADRSLDWGMRRFDARCFLLEHRSKGLILVDTGYGAALKDALKQGINALYGKLLPFTYQDEDSIVLQLQTDGIRLSDLSYLVITHFHPDHIGALPEFANVPWIYRKDTLDELSSMSMIKQLKKGFFSTLIPEIPKNSIALQREDFVENWNGFAAHDLFDDHSLQLIDLPGHAQGQMGVLTGNNFMVADALWGGKSLPNWLGLLVQDNPKAYLQTYKALRSIENDFTLYPTHTITAYE